MPPRPLDSAIEELLWVKRNFKHHIGFLRTRTQRSGTQCNGTRTRSPCVPTLLFEYDQGQ
jgi:hypothetical protein